MDTAASEAVYQFEGFVLDLVRGALRDPKGMEVPLRAKSFELLRLFVTNSGRLLDRETINQAIWSDVVVTDDAITQCVRDIRRVLGDEQQRILKTVQRRGYIFGALVTTGDKQPLTLPTAEPLPLSGKPSIAVLAFTNMSGDLEQEYFSDGIADEIITELSRSRSLFVIARNSSFTYKGRTVDVKLIARELGVRYVLEGSVRRSGGRVRVIAQLIDAETGNHIWAERYDRALEDVFAVQDEITAAVTTAILPAVMDAEQRRALRKPPESLGAWEAYQRGLWHATKATAEDNERARDFFRRSAELAPSFASPHAMLAYFYGWGFASADILPVRDINDLARYEAQQAIDLDPDDVTAHAVLSWVSMCDGDYSTAREQADHAVHVAPSDAIAWLAKGRVSVFSGRPADAQEALQIALRLSPRGPVSWIVLLTLAISHYFQGNYHATVEVAQRTIRAHPEFALPYRWLAAALGQLGGSKAAREALGKAIQVSQQSFDFYARGRPPWFRTEDHEQMLDGLRKAGWQG